MSDDSRDPAPPPLSGGRDGRGPSASDVTEPPGDHGARGHDATSVDEGDTRSGPTGSPRTVDDDLAPVIPLFGGSAARRSEGPGDAHPSRGRAALGVPAAEDAVPPPTRPRLRALRSDVSAGAPGHGASSAWNIPGAATRDADATDSSAGDSDVAERAEALLLRKLRSRSLSLAEARTAIRGVDGADEAVVEDVVTRFVDLGYLDDAAFAEQLAMSAVEKRGDGRRAVAETLRKRGIPRDVADATLAQLPDDDAERALDFARSKVRGVEGKDYEAALRRLAGQLARRGYPSSVALSAAKTALSEAGVGRARSFGRPASGVRFTPDE